VDDVHRGESDDEPTVLLITYAGTSGVATSVPAKGEKAKYDSGCANEHHRRNESSWWMRMNATRGPF
jgi:hypothetical protein